MLISKEINKLIKESMLAKAHTKTRTLRALKDMFLLHTTAKNAKPLDQAAEIQIIEKMVKQRKDSARQYLEAGRKDLTLIEIGELEILEKFLPEPVSISEIDKWVEDYCHKNNYYDMMGIVIKYTLPKKEMGKVIKLVKEALPGASNRDIADTVKSFL